MCGIVGYIGKRQAYPILIKGLRRLEYRGYDSAGVGLISSSDKLNIYKAKGKVRPYTLGDPRRTVPSQCSSACFAIGQPRIGAQRHHRKLCRLARPTQGKGISLPKFDRYGSVGATD